MLCGLEVLTEHKREGEGHHSTAHLASSDTGCLSLVVEVACSHRG